MKKFVIKGMLALGASGLMAMAQTTPPPQSAQTRTRSTTETSTDNQMATKVRQGLMSDQNIGAAAHNVKVSSRNGMVTLRGKVSTAEEKDMIVSKAKQIAGDSNVKDEITVAKK